MVRNDVQLHPTSDLPSIKYTGSAAPTNHYWMERVSGSGPFSLCGACATGNSGNTVGLYDDHYGLAAFDNPNGKYVEPQNGGVQHVVLSGSCSIEDDLVTASDGRCIVASTYAAGTRNVMAKAITAGADGDTIPARIYEQPVLR